MEKQSMSLAAAVGLPVVLMRFSARPPWRWLPPRFWPLPLRGVRFQTGDPGPPWPVLTIGTGKRTVAPALALRRLGRPVTRSVHIQNPRVPPAAFDLVVAPQHDGMRAPNLVTTDGALHDITPERLNRAAARCRGMVDGLARPFTTVLLGGDSRHHTFRPADCRRLCDWLTGLSRSGSLLITASRRTPAAVVAALRARVPTARCRIRDDQIRGGQIRGGQIRGGQIRDDQIRDDRIRDGENPYLGFLALADRLIVTSDSVNMLCEASATGKPIHVFALSGGSARLEAFHRHMVALGVSRPLGAVPAGGPGPLPVWRYTPPSDLGRAAAAVRRLLDTGLSPRGPAV